MYKLTQVAYCGLYCDLCAERGRIPNQAEALRASMAKEGYSSWAKNLENFSEFWRFLNRLSDPEKCCPGCRNDGGYPDCAIRKCARERDADLCLECADYPCEHIEALSRIYPCLIADNRRMAEIGMEAWVIEQEQRARAGFTYADIRCRPLAESDNE